MFKMSKMFLAIVDLLFFGIELFSALSLGSNIEFINTSDTLLQPSIKQNY